MARRAAAKNGDDNDMLAAEYVLGVLDSPARAEAERLAGRDPVFAAAVEAWTERLAPMNGAYREVMPPDAVRKSLEQRMFGGPMENTSRKTAPFWRPLALAALAALALTIGLQFQTASVPPAQPAIVASLDPADVSAGEMRFLALYEPGRDMLRVASVAGKPGDGQAFELWLVAGEDAPVSLGVIADPAAAMVKVAPTLKSRLLAGATLAVSIEPAGGSPTGTPTGPVVAAGAARPI